MSFVCIPVRMNLIKAHRGKGSGPFSFERSATSPPQADHVLVDLFLIRGGRGCSIKAPRQGLAFWQLGVWLTVSCELIAMTPPFILRAHHIQIK